VALSIIPCNIDGVSTETFEGSTDPIQGWVSYDYAVKIAAPVLKYSKKAAAPARFATVLCASKGVKPEITASWIDENVLEIIKDGKKDVIVFADGQATKYCDTEFDGQVLLAEVDSDGKAKTVFSA